VFYYLTVMNENYKHPALPERANVKEDILKGMYLLQEAEGTGHHKVQLMGSGVILEEVMRGAELLKQDFNIDADIWSVTSFNLVNRDLQEVLRYNRLHPTGEQKVPFMTAQLAGHEGPVIASTDYIRSNLQTVCVLASKPITPCWAPMVSVVLILALTCAASSK
jgi:pyruvate dehydrogenase E1 component